MMRLSTFPPLTSSSGVRRCLERIRSGRNHNNNLENVKQFKFTPKIEDIGKWRPSWRSFDYQELAAATDGFSPGDVQKQYHELLRSRYPFGFMFSKVHDHSIIESLLQGNLRI